MSKLIDAKIIVSKVNRGYEIKIEVGGRTLPFSKLKLDNDKFNGKDCKIERIDGQITRIIVDDKTIFPVPKTHNQQSKHTNSNRQIGQHSQSHNQVNPNKTNSSGEEEMNDSYNPNNTMFIPSDTKTSISSLSDIDNFALKLNKAARFDEVDNKFKFFHKKTKQNPIPSYCIKENYGDLNFPDFKNKMKGIKTSFESQGYTLTEPITRTTDWRLIIGLGNESVYETSMTLHHIYGIPYIPGSAVKGVTRNYVITNHFGNNDANELDLKNAEERALKDPEFLNIFGNGDQQGKVIFFDAFPTEAPKLQPDIMNPHYGDYYSSKKDKNGNPIPPADYLSPNPIFFLTVNAPFDFYLGIKQKDNKDKDAPLDTAEKWLNQALTKHGIGAKTAVGYGYFT